MRIALLIDGDNISPKYLPAIMSEMQQRGTCSIKRIYGDWTTPHMGGWKKHLNQYCVRPVQQFRNGENATDNAMIMDAMEILLAHDRIDCYCIISSDSDFYSLCLRIREHGRTVIAIGNRNTREILQRACDEFVFLENLSISGQKKEEDQANDDPAEEDLSDPEVLLVKAYSICDNEQEWVPLSTLGTISKSMNSSFDPRTYNHWNLRSLIESLDIFELRKDDNLPPSYFCRLKKTSETKTIERHEGVIKDFRQYYGFIQGRDGDYYFTRTNILRDQKNVWIKRGMRVLFDVLESPDPEGTETHEINGKAGNVEFIDALPG